MFRKLLLDRAVRDKFPTPLAAAWHDIELQSGPEAQLQASLRALEVLLRLLCAVVLPDYLRGPPSQEVERGLEALRRPSLGHFAFLIEQALAAIDSRGSPGAFAPEALQWFQDRRGAEAPRERLRKLIELRNQHAHFLPGGAIASDLPILLRELMEGLDWLARFRIFRVVEQRHSRSGWFIGSFQIFKGRHLQPLPVPARWRATLYDDAVYLADPRGRRFMEISPFVQVLPPRSSPAEGWPFLFQKVDRAHRMVLQGGQPLRMECSRITLDDLDLDFSQWLADRGHLHPLIENPVELAPWAEPYEAGDLREGAVIAERFEVRGKLGEGGMAQVFLAVDRTTDQDVALKLVRSHLAGNEEFEVRFRREVTALQRVSHPRVVRIWGSGVTQDGVPYLVMPVLSGGTLAERLPPDGFDPEKVLELAQQMIEAVAAIHARGIVHRDLKPSNFLLDEGGGLVLADFGIVLRPGEGRYTATHRRGELGSVAYMAPEQRLGRALGPAADLYTLGLLYCELITGQPLPSRKVALVQSSLWPLIRRLLEDDPEDRPSTEEVRQEVTALVHTTPPPPPGSPLLLRVFRALQRAQAEGISLVVGETGSEAEVDRLEASLEAQLASRTKALETPPTASRPMAPSLTTTPHPPAEASSPPSSPAPGAGQAPRHFADVARRLTDLKPPVEPPEAQEREAAPPELARKQRGRVRLVRPDRAPPRWEAGTRLGDRYLVERFVDAWQGRTCYLVKDTRCPVCHAIEVVDSKCRGCGSEQSIPRLLLLVRWRASTFPCMREFAKTSSPLPGVAMPLDVVDHGGALCLISAVSMEWMLREVPAPIDRERLVGMGQALLEAASGLVAAGFVPVGLRPTQVLISSQGARIFDPDLRALEPEEEPTEALEQVASDIAVLVGARAAPWERELRRFARRPHPRGRWLGPMLKEILPPPTAPRWLTVGVLSLRGSPVQLETIWDWISSIDGGACLALICSPSRDAGFRDLVDRALRDLLPPRVEALGELSLHSLEEAVDEILRRCSEILDRERIVASACVVYLQRTGGALVGNVGSHRGYLLRRGRLSQVVSDAGFPPLRQLGGHDQPEIDHFRLDLAPGDRLLLCGHGIWGALDANTLLEILANQVVATDAVQVLIAQAQANGGEAELVAQIFDLPEWW